MHQPAPHSYIGWRGHEHHKGDGTLSCIHHRKTFFIGIGHPRCGTGFTSHLMRTSGLQIGHEHVNHNGIVSWMLPGEKYRNPYRDAIGPLAGFNRIFCIARAPLDAMGSIIPEQNNWPSFNFRRGILKARFGETLPDAKADPSRLLASVISYTLWFELCMSFLPQIIFRVDRPEDDALLSDYIGRTVTRSAEVPRNSRPEVRAAEFAPSDLADLPREWLDRLAVVAEGLGYPEDAAQITAIAAG